MLEYFACFMLGVVLGMLSIIAACMIALIKEETRLYHQLTRNDKDE